MNEIGAEYGLRIKSILTYSSKKWYYVLLKTLCIIVGLPLYIVLIPLDFLNFLVFCLFSWIPLLKVVFLFLCKIVSTLCGLGYYVGILPDAKEYIAASKAEHDREMAEMQAAIEADKADEKTQVAEENQDKTDGKDE